MILKDVIEVVNNKQKQGFQGQDMPALTLLGKREVFIPVMVSCIVGVAISFFGLNTRLALTSTAFTVLGVVNKFLTVLVNTLVWSRHSSQQGIFFVTLTIVGGIMYQQFTGTSSVTPPKEKEKTEQPSVESPEDSSPVPTPAVSTTNRSASTFSATVEVFCDR